MNRIFAALILSTAAIGAVHAGETGYLDNPGVQTQSSVSRAQIQNELNTDRASVHAFRGELNPAAGQTTAHAVTPVSTGNSTVGTRAEVRTRHTAGSIAFVNG